MADVDNGDILRIGSSFVFDAFYDVVNVWHVLAELDTGISWAQVTTFVQAYMDAVYAPLKTPMNDEMSTETHSIANVTQATTLGSVPWSPSWGGADTGDQTASGVCCFTWARTYKPRVQIRKYFGVFSDSQVLNGAWITAVITGCEGAMTVHIAKTLLAAGKYFTGVAYNRTLGTYNTAYSVDSSLEPAYQRRRKRGRGS